MKARESKARALDRWATVLSAVSAFLLLISMGFGADSEENPKASSPEIEAIIIRIERTALLELERTLWHTGASDDDHRCAGAWSLNHDFCEAVTQGSELQFRFVGIFRVKPIRGAFL